METAAAPRKAQSAAPSCVGWTKVPFGTELSLIRNPPAVPLGGAYIEYQIRGRKLPATPQLTTIPDKKVQ